MPVVINTFRATAVVASISMSGTLSGGSAPTTVTGASATATVPVGNSGVARMQDLDMTGFVLPRCNVNGGGMSSFAEGDTVTLANGDTLQFEITGAASGEALQFNLVDVTTGALIQTVNLVSA